MAERKPTLKLTAGARAFAAFLHERKLSDAKAGEAMGVTDVTVYHWRIGAKVPKDVGRRKIEIFTSQVDEHGIVLRAGIAPSLWSDGADEKALEKVRPHDAPPRPPSVPPPSGPAKPSRAARPRAASPVPPGVRGARTRKGTPKAEAAA